MTLIHSARTTDDVIFGDELRTMPSLRFVEHHTQTQGSLTVDQVRALLPDLSERATWMCGSAGMLEDFSSIPATVERFRPALAAVAEGGTVRFTGSGAEAEVAGSTSLLEAGEQAGGPQTSTADRCCA